MVDRRHRQPGPSRLWTRESLGALGQEPGGTGRRDGEDESGHHRTASAGPAPQPRTRIQTQRPSNRSAAERNLPIVVKHGGGAEYGKRADRRRLMDDRAVHVTAARQVRRPVEWSPTVRECPDRVPVPGRSRTDAGQSSPLLAWTRAERDTKPSKRSRSRAEG